MYLCNYCFLVAGVSSESCWRKTAALQAVSF